MLTETSQISNLRNQDVSNEILSNLERKDVAEFNDKFFHFQYATLEVFKAALNNYFMLKLCFSINILIFAMYCKNVSLQYYATNQDTKPNSLSQSCPKLVLYQCLSFFICHSFFYYATFFPLRGKLKIITHFLFVISNDIIQCYKFSRWILLLLPSLLLLLLLIAPNIDIVCCYWTNGTQSLKSMNLIHKMSIDLSRI